MISSRYVCKKPFDPTDGMASSLGKRKTPTELRLEQLKRHQLSKVGEQDEKLPDSQGFSIQPRDAVLPCRLPGDDEAADFHAPDDSREKFRFRLVRSFKEKDTCSVPQQEASQQGAAIPGKSCADSISLFSRYKNDIPSNSSTKTGAQLDGGKKEVLPLKVEEKVKGLYDCAFRDVRDISNSQSLLKAESSIDMVEALKKLAPRKVLGSFDFNAGLIPTEHSNDLNDRLGADNGSVTRANTLPRSGLPISTGPVEDSKTWLPFKGCYAPLDLSLKQMARFTSPDSLHWCHRLSSNIQCKGVQQFTQGLGVLSRKEDSVRPMSCSERSADDEKLGATLWSSLHSWVYPQSTLPPAVLSVISSAAARGGEAERSFLSKRDRAWEAAFRSLYYNFRSQFCSVFYVCMQQFVAMFVGGGVGGRSQGACTAYLTRSTRGVRQVLLEHDVKFSMPFSTSGDPTTTVEDLQDLLEFEKSNPGQTRMANEKAASDNGPQSMLCFEGYSNVHRLYDFLINHRFLLNSTAAMDVPVLYAPTAFENACLTAPEITCKQLQRTDGFIKPPVNNSKKNISPKCTETASNTMYTMEIKGSFLPPWVIIRLCAVLQESQPLGYSVRFATEPLTEGLNIAQEERTDSSKPANFKNFFSNLNGATNGDTISETKMESSTVSSSELNHSSGIGTAVVKELKYEGDSYRAALAPLQLATSS
ncbi:uncharacterized protein [Physcomitrium patens]|uniref:Protein downstream neighbor of Son n=1 Tax=Physcomitrium patens TaxID=3218 RepID=A0A2K1ICA2_PHYPA|nr:uncharacterized protein LOC112277696 [Physcomitrium patens]PNR26894.1 hypothetical protein PHYPA_030375 [Physcomitrium patens]|eukprot:XP_024366090.1 uncharacterized protein LOC112277696 [Physcomitrella patens]